VRRANGRRSRTVVGSRVFLAALYARYPARSRHSANARFPPKDLYGAIAVKCADSEHLLVRLASDISSSRPDFRADAARSGRQGWPKAIAQRLALDRREHSVKFPQSGDTGASRSFSSVLTTATLPRGSSPLGARRASRTCIRPTTKDHDAVMPAARLQGAGPF